jgi:hypothetical protein
MSSNNVSTNEVSVDEQAYKHADEERVDEDGFPVVDETPELQGTVQMEIQAKVDANHPDARIEEGEEHLIGKTLAEEEKIRADEEELEHISAQSILGPQDGRATRTREIVVDNLGNAHEQKSDPREALSQDELAAVNKQAVRIDERVAGGWSRAAIARRLAERVAAGQELMDAVLNTLEQAKHESGVIVPIDEVPDLGTSEVSVEGEVIELYEDTHPAVHQAGLLADDSGVIKFTTWRKSMQPTVREGQRVRLRAVQTNWHNERCSLAVTGWSIVEFPEAERGWD